MTIRCVVTRVELLSDIVDVYQMSKYSDPVLSPRRCQPTVGPYEVECLFQVLSERLG